MTRNFIAHRVHFYHFSSCNIEVNVVDRISKFMYIELQRFAQYLDSIRESIVFQILEKPLFRTYERSFLQCNSYLDDFIDRRLRDRLICAVDIVLKKLLETLRSAAGKHNKQTLRQLNIVLASSTAAHTWKHR